MKLIEKKKYLTSTMQILRASQKEKRKYKTKVLGKEFVVYPNVFSPKYFTDTAFFAKNIPIRKGETFLEIGSGTGVISVFAALKGAKNVVATDINPSAVKNTKENAAKHHVKIKTIQGNLFSPIKKKRFDNIFWNTPFAYSDKKVSSVLEKAVIDTKYSATKRFLKQAKRHLTPDGRLLIGFSSTLGDWGGLKNILKTNKYRFKIIKEIWSTEVHPVKFQIIEATL